MPSINITCNIYITITNSISDSKTIYQFLCCLSVTVKQYINFYVNCYTVLCNLHYIQAPQCFRVLLFSLSHFIE